MNALVLNRPPAHPPAPRKYTADDIFFWLSTGFVAPDAKFELLDGEMIPASPKERFHEAMRERLMEWLDQPWRTNRFKLMLEHTLKLDDGTLLEPDFLLYDRAARIQDRALVGADIRLIIEVADSSWSYDTNAKAAKYAGFGVAEYWVIHAVKNVVRVHRGPSASSWNETHDPAASDTLIPLCAPETGFVLAP